MAHITRTININAPLSRVFDYVTNPENWTRYVTSLIDVKNVSNKTPVAGTTFEWVYRMLGMNFSGKGSITEYEKDKKFVLRMEGAFPIKETYHFERDKKGTKLTFEIDYEMPGQLLGVIAKSRVIEKLNIREADTVLEKVKTLCEAL